MLYLIFRFMHTANSFFFFFFDTAFHSERTFLSLRPKKRLLPGAAPGTSSSTTATSESERDPSHSRGRPSREDGYTWLVLQKTQTPSSSSSACLQDAHETNKRRMEITGQSFFYHTRVSTTGEKVVFLRLFKHWTLITLSIQLAVTSTTRNKLINRLLFYYRQSLDTKWQSWSK